MAPFSRITYCIINITLNILFIFQSRVDLFLKTEWLYPDRQNQYKKPLWQLNVRVIFVFYFISLLNQLLIPKPAKTFYKQKSRADG